MSDDRWTVASGDLRELERVVHEFRQRLRAEDLDVDEAVREFRGRLNMQECATLEFRDQLIDASDATWGERFGGLHAEISDLPYRFKLNTYVRHVERKCNSFVRPARPVPPNGAFFVLDLLLSKTDRAVLPGDLEEEFTTSILPNYGARRARFWFWTQTVRTIARRNPVCRWILVGGLMRLGEWISRQIGG
jgi:hypothetical protein